MAVCVIYSEIKITALFELVRFITKLIIALLLGHPIFLLTRLAAGHGLLNCAATRICG